MAVNSSDLARFKQKQLMKKLSGILPTQQINASNKMTYFDEIELLGNVQSPNKAKEYVANQSIRRQNLLSEAD